MSQITSCIEYLLPTYNILMLRFNSQIRLKNLAVLAVLIQFVDYSAGRISEHPVYLRRDELTKCRWTRYRCRLSAPTAAGVATDASKSKIDHSSFSGRWKAAYDAGGRPFALHGAAA